MVPTPFRPTDFWKALLSYFKTPVLDLTDHVDHLAGAECHGHNPGWPPARWIDRDVHLFAIPHRMLVDAIVQHFFDKAHRCHRRGCCHHPVCRYTCRAGDGYAHANRASLHSLHCIRTHLCFSAISTFIFPRAGKGSILLVSRESCQFSYKRKNLPFCI